MKKKTLLLTGLILLPLVMGLLSATPTVKVTEEDAVRYVTFMELIQGSSVGWCPYIASVLNYTSLGLAVLFLFLKKEWFLRYTMWLSAGACVLISFTLSTQGAVQIAPNILALFFTGAEGILAYYVHEHPELVGGMDEEKTFRLGLK